MTAYVCNEKILDDYILILNICVTINSIYKPTIDLNY